ncbi:uncharacterized protein LOC122543942 isoform X4 [Chiloscyllium plagiosum]|nr:uncharacterized protein LOC122543942 isoform X3 [Chiloscyllium plagiosum]XP_043538838.1 uncharacterized protein LOC122543942 isoform X4 [Chiloscyllium plagiosum]
MIGPGLSPPSLLGTRRSSAHASSRDINENDLQIGTSEQVLSVSAVIRISILLVFNCGRKKVLFPLFNYVNSPYVNHDHWLFILLLQNVLQPLQDIFHPGTG